MTSFLTKLLGTPSTAISCQVTVVQETRSAHLLLKIHDLLVLRHQKSQHLPIAAFQRQKIPSSVKEEIFDAKEIVDERNPVGLLQQSLEKGKSEDEAHSSIQKELSSASLVQEEVQERAPPCELGNKKNSFLSLGGKPVADGDLFWGTSEAIAAANYMGPFSTSANNNPCWVCSSEWKVIWLRTIIIMVIVMLVLHMEECVLNPFGGDQGSYAPCRSREHVKDQKELSKEVRRSADCRPFINQI